MTDLVTAMRDFNKDRKFSRKGPLCVALVVTQHARKMGLPLNPDTLLTKAGGQVLGLGKDAVQAVLNRHGITSVLAVFEADLHATVAWAQAQQRRWALTLSNAGSYLFEDRCDLARLDEVDWAAVQARDWRQCKEGKQAEFLLEHSFPWHLIERIGVLNRTIYQHVVNALPVNGHRPTVEIRPDWYY